MFASAETIVFFFSLVFQCDGYVKPDMEVQFFLYTQSNPKTPDLIQVNNTKSLSDSHFDENNDIRIVTHGFESSYLEESIQTILKGYIKSNCSLNIILVNWKKAKKMQCKTIVLHYICLTLVGGSLKRVGASINEFIGFLMKNKPKITFNKIHLIGHSLGAHISGYAGNMRNGRYGAIFGLDPAGPAFRLLPHKSKLNKTSAKYVAIFHTSKALGISQPLGDGDFYFNYGYKQPKCSSIFDLTCNHNAATEYFSHYLYDAMFYGSECKYKNILAKKCGKCNIQQNCVNMTSIIYERKSGTIFINTTSNSPFGIPHKKTDCQYIYKP